MICSDLCSTDSHAKHLAACRTIMISQIHFGLVTVRATSWNYLTYLTLTVTDILEAF